MLWRKREKLTKMKNAWVWPLVGSLISGAASYFGGKKKKEDPVQYSNIDLKNITDFPTGSTLNTRILNALNKGEGIGYPAEYINRSTSPFIASRESRFTENELPAMNAEYGSRGLSRSTLATRDIGKAYAQKERDVNEIMANAYMKNLEQGKTDTARYENLADTFSQNQATLENQEELYNAGIGNKNLELSKASELNNANNSYANLNQAIGSGLGVFDVLSGNNGVGSTTSSNDTNSIINMIRQVLASRSGSPFVN